MGGFRHIRQAKDRRRSWAYLAYNAQFLVTEWTIETDTFRTIEEFEFGPERGERQAARTLAKTYVDSCRALYELGLAEDTLTEARTILKDMMSRNR